MDAMEEIEKYAHLLAITAKASERAKQRNRLLEMLNRLRLREQALRLREDLLVQTLTRQ
jgi:hypothetical protein